MGKIDPSDVSREMRRYRVQRVIEKEVNGQERKWYKHRDEIDQKKRVAEIRKIIERATNNDN